MSSRYQPISSTDAAPLLNTSQRHQYEDRLPEGLERVGYGADTQTYTFRDDEDGTLWESEPGVRDGRLRPVGARVEVREGDDVYLQRAKREDWRYMAPFFLLVLLVLLVVWRFFGPPLFASGASGMKCPEGAERYVVKAGDSCWGIAERLGSSVDGLKRLNAGLECNGLRPGMRMCVPAQSGSG